VRLVVEVELQYVYTGKAAPSVPIELAHLALAGSESVAIVDTYFDTDKLAIRRAGCSLRIRVTDLEPNPVLTWKGEATRKDDPKGKKKRPETEVPVDAVPDSGDGLVQMLREQGLWEEVQAAAGLEDGAVLHSIGRIRNRRSTHTYVNGLHRLELSWDRVEFPVGPPEVRVEVEVKFDHAEDYLARADEELRKLFGDDLVVPERGKVRELCERLYPALIAA